MKAITRLLIISLSLTLPCMLEAQVWTELSGTNAFSDSFNNAVTNYIYIQKVCGDASGNIYAGGRFRNDTQHSCVAKFDGRSWSELGGPSSLHTYIDGDVFALYTDPAGNVYAGGYFTNASFNIYIAKFDGTGWTELGGPNSLAVQGGIYSICGDRAGNIYCAGTFSNASGHYYVAKYDGTSWTEVGGLDGLAAAGPISVICMDRMDNLYAAGSFTNDGSPGFGHYFVAKFDGRWSELGGRDSLAANAEIYALCSDSSGNIYTAGSFVNASGKRYVAKYDGSRWSELGGVNSLAADWYIYALCTDRAGNVYTGGNFFNPEGHEYVARYDGSHWSELGGSDALQADKMIYTLCSDPTGNIYAAGEFTNTDSVVYVAKYTQPTLAVREVEASAVLTAYPNPGTLFHIRTSGDISREDIRITDISGRTIAAVVSRSVDGYDLDMSAEPNGVYYITLSHSGYASTMKLIKMDI